MSEPAEQGATPEGRDPKVVANYLRAKNPEVNVPGGSVHLFNLISSNRGVQGGEARLEEVLREYLEDSGESPAFYRDLARALLQHPSTRVREEFADIRRQGSGEMVKYLRERNPVTELAAWGSGAFADHLKSPDHVKAVSAQYGRMLEHFDATQHEEAGAARIAGALRYFLEGRDDTYDSDAAFYLRLAKDLLAQLPEDNRRMLDLGCGNAAKKLALWDEMVNTEGAASLGVDGSSTFALSGAAETKNIAVGTIDAKTHELRRQVGDILNDEFGIVLANLVLDRVADPAQLIRNMHEFLAPGGTAVLGCLLPNTGEDDEELPDPLQHIVYTPQENRITKGKHAYADAEQIRKRIEQELGVKVKVTRQPYHWKSSGGEGVYDKHFIFEWTKPEVKRDEA